MDSYEKWGAKPAPKTYSNEFVGVCSGYLQGHSSTITVTLYAASLEDAKRMFNGIIIDSRMVNPSSYHVTRKD